MRQNMALNIKFVRFRPTILCLEDRAKQVTSTSPQSEIEPSAICEIPYLMRPFAEAMTNVRAIVRP